MADSNLTPDLEQSEKNRNPKYDAVLIQLSSQRPSDVWRGMEQVRQWLKEDLENRDVYGLLLDAVQANRDLLRDKIRSLFTEMMEKGSESAKEALSSLPTGIQDLLADADDVYYAAEYERAIKLYRQVIKLDLENVRAKDQLAKAELMRITGESAGDLPRAAEQFYRRARSYIAARDVVAAVNLLTAAIEAAQAKNKKYPDAEQALSGMHNLITAEEFKTKAYVALDKAKWKEAIDHYEKALTLDPINPITKKELESLQNLLEVEIQLKSTGVSKYFASISRWQSIMNSAKIVFNTENALIKSLDKQLRKILWTRYLTLAALFLGITVFLFFIRSTLFPPLLQPPTTSTNTLQATASTSIDTNSISTFEPTLAITATFTETPTVTLTETSTLTPTQASLGTGYIIKAFVSSWEVPNERFIESLGLYQPVTVLEKEEVAGSTWYRCSWTNKDGLAREGWILGQYITFGIPPTPRP